MNKFKAEQNFVLLLPIINFFASFLTKFPGFNIAGINAGEVRAVVLNLFLFYFLTNKNLRNTPLISIIAITLIYFLIISMFSSNPMASILLWNKVFIATMFLPLGYYYIKTIEDFSVLFRNCFIILFLIIINTIFSNLLGIGESSYTESAISFGEGGVNILKVIPLIVILFPLINYTTLSTKWKKIIFYVFFVSFLLLFIGFKRGTLLAVIIGFIYYIWNSPQKKKILKILPMGVILLLPLIFIFQEKISVVYDARQAKGQTSITDITESGEEGRMLELIWVIEKFPDKNILNQLFGEDFLLGRRDALGIRGLYRMNHIDYTALLDSSGIIGFLLFLLFYILLYKKVKKYYHYSDKNSFTKELRLIANSLVFILIILGISGTISSIDIRALAFLLIGGILGLMRQNVIHPIR